MAAALLRSIALGEDYFGLQCRKPAFVGAISSDRPWKDHQLWFNSVGLPDIPHYSLIDDEDLTGGYIRKKNTDRFGLFVRSLRNLIDPTPWDSLIFVDPISLFTGGNPLDYDKTYTHLFDFSQLCIKEGITIIGTAHAGKQKSDVKDRYARPQDRILGTTAQTGCVGTTFHLAPPNETGEDWHEFTWVPHHAAAGFLRLSRDAEGLFVPLTGVEPTNKEKRSLAGAMRVLEVFPDQGTDISTKDLVLRCTTVLGIKRRMVLRHLAKLAAEQLVESLRPGWWRRRPILSA